MSLDPQIINLALFELMRIDFRVYFVFYGRSIVIAIVFDRTSVI